MCRLVYPIGLNLTAVMLVVRGVSQMLMPELSSGVSAAISGMAGIGHILPGVSPVLLLIQIRHNLLTAQDRFGAAGQNFSDSAFSARQSQDFTIYLMITGFAKRFL